MHLLLRPSPLLRGGAVGWQYIMPGKQGKFLRARPRREPPPLTHGAPPFVDELPLPIMHILSPTGEALQLSVLEIAAYALPAPTKFLPESRGKSAYREKEHCQVQFQAQRCAEESWIAHWLQSPRCARPAP